MSETTLTMRLRKSSNTSIAFGLIILLAVGLLAFRGAVCIVIDDHSAALNYLVCLRVERALELDSLPPSRECISPVE